MNEKEVIKDGMTFIVNRSSYCAFLVTFLVTLFLTVEFISSCLKITTEIISFSGLFLNKSH